MSADTALILVVDDNEMNRDMLSRRLTRQSYDVEMAEDGIKALEMMRAHDFDLVLLDIMMPRMNGYEVLEKVKADEALRHVPIIMISAVDDIESVVKCIEMGAEDYLFKPFNPVLLKARVGASLDKKRLLDNQSTPSASGVDIDALKTIANELDDVFVPLRDGLQNIASADVPTMQSSIERATALLDELKRSLA